MPSSAAFEGRSLVDPAELPAVAGLLCNDLLSCVGARKERARHKAVADAAGRWKMLRSQRFGFIELNDLARDPDELHNLAAERPDVLTRLLRLERRLLQDARRNEDGQGQMTPYCLR